MDIITRVKIRLGIPASESKYDDLLNLQIADAETFFKDYCKRKDIPPQAGGIIEQLVVTLRQSHSGVQNEKVGDTSVTYFEQIISEDLKRQLNRYRFIKVL
ncbi:phage head-tail connector protein [Schinkia azotoformans]|uniref:phage head-tail connector protein n=1 Tax=Schinkia azotoformans TaxID=1454 RepID=UPI002E2254A5|nr:phage head-tail connector protein [Schinkia azotoformans]